MCAAFRNLCPLLAAASLLFATRVVCAAPPGESAADYYGYATGHLKSGKWFERAAGQLKEAIRREPDNYRYHLALGCAYASRAASLSYAAAFTQTLTAYNKEYSQILADWKKAQKDPEDDEYGDPRPEPIPKMIFRTKDDQKPFQMTKAQASRRVEELRTAAAAAWEKAAVLAQTDTERAEVHNVRGWGLWLLRRFEEPFFPSQPTESLAAPKETLTALTAATDLAPGSAVYWQALGDALPDREKATAAYRRSLQIQKRNAPLWYRLYRWEMKPLPPPSHIGGPAPAPRLPTDSEPAREYLRRAAESDPSNAFTWYLLAYSIFREGQYGEVLGVGGDKQEASIMRIAVEAGEAERKTAREAVAFIERGNNARRYSQLTYRPAIPVLLAAAWDYLRRADILGDIDLHSSSRLRELARAAGGYALVEAKRNNGREAERTARAAIGIGYKLVGDWPVKDSFPEDKLLITGLVGKAIVAIGYITLERVYRLLGDPAGAERAAAERATFRQRADAHRKMVEENLARMTDFRWHLEQY